MGEEALGSMARQAVRGNPLLRDHATQSLVTYSQNASPASGP